MKTIATIFGVSSLASTWLAGAFGVLVVAQVGPFLAMGARMYAGETEPRQPVVVVPWALLVVTGLIPLPLAWKRRWAWASAAALPFALVPWWMLWGLYGATV